MLWAESITTTCPLIKSEQSFFTNSDLIASAGLKPKFALNLSINSTKHIHPHVLRFEFLTRNGKKSKKEFYNARSNKHIFNIVESIPIIMNFLSPFILLFLFSSVTISLVGKSDYDVVIGTRHAQLRFLNELFAVKPGSLVNLTLDNTDEMIHNLVLANGDSSEINRLAELALKLGEHGMKMGFVPKDPSIIASIGLVQPGERVRFNLSPLWRKEIILMSVLFLVILDYAWSDEGGGRSIFVNLAEIKIASPGTTPKERSIGSGGGSEGGSRACFRSRFWTFDCGRIAWWI